MLVCNVSLKAPRAGIAADLSEPAQALDASAIGYVVFATLVDDPASVRETIDAYLGEIMVEAASAAASVNAGLTYAASVVEAAHAADTINTGSGYTGTIVETATGTDTQSGTVLAALGITGTPVTTGTEYEHGVGSTYAGFTVTATGGTAPYIYSVASGTLPSGITLNSSTGAVSGTPGFQSAGTYSGIVIRATDAVSQTVDLASFTLTVSFKDPYYSNLSLLLDYDAPNGTTTFVDQKFGVSMSLQGTPQHSTAVTPLYGTSSILLNGSSSLKLADAAKFHLGTASFTIDFTVRPTSVTGTQFWMGQWGSASQLMWELNMNAATVQFNVSTTGSNNLADVAGAAISINVWSRWRLDFDGTKYRLYKDGAMVASSTTLRSIFTTAGNAFAIGSNSTTSFFLNGNCRGIRLTLGTARTASDSGYTISNRAFPTS